METHLLEFTDTDDVDSVAATVQFGIPKRLRLVLARSNRWGRIRCEISYAMTSKYAIALYEMVCLRANLERCTETIEMARFRELLGVPPGAYERADNFMRNVIAPAVLEVSGLSNISVQIDMVRRHPRAPAHAVALTWWRKQGEEFRQVVRELRQPKVGRMARLKGQVEELTRDKAALVNAEVAEMLEKMRERPAAAEGPVATTRPVAAEPVKPRLPSPAAQAELAARLEKMREEREAAEQAAAAKPMAAE
jgi:hypothetical protein